VVVGAEFYNSPRTSCWGIVSLSQNLKAMNAMGLQLLSGWYMCHQPQLVWSLLVYYKKPAPVRKQHRNQRRLRAG
jgi:hypothetical protein